MFAVSLCHCVTVRASTDPKSATQSATATVPASTASTSDTQSPTAPILIRPLDGTTTSDGRPEFVWRRSSDPNGNTVFYTIYLNGVATYLGISDQGNSASSLYTARIEANEVKLLPSVSLEDGVYDWYVRAYDPSGNASLSTSWRLIIDSSPPPLTLVDLDNLPSPPIFEGANFDIAGPKDIYFTVFSDPFIDIQITLTDPQSNPSLLKSQTNSEGLAYLYRHLLPGKYTVSVVALDRGNNATALPVFTLTITQAEIKIPLPPIPGLPPSYTLPYTPYTIPTLPATISQLQTTRYELLLLIRVLLAFFIYILLVFLWRRKPNLLLLDSRGRPLSNTIVYHSLPTTRSRFTPILVTKMAPISYLLSRDSGGWLSIPRLNRYSTLTVRTDSATYILSLCAKRQTYTLVLG